MRDEKSRMVWQGRPMKSVIPWKGYNRVYIGIKALRDRNFKLSKLNLHEISEKKNTLSYSIQALEFT